MSLLNLFFIPFPCISFLLFILLKPLLILLKKLLLISFGVALMIRIVIIGLNGKIFVSPKMKVEWDLDLFMILESLFLSKLGGLLELLILF